MGGDSKKGNQLWKCYFHEEKVHRTKNCRALKIFLDKLIQDGPLKEYVDQDNTQTKEAEVRPNPRFDRCHEKANDALEEDLPQGTIHMIEVPHHSDPENRIQGVIHIVRQMHKVISN